MQTGITDGGANFTVTSDTYIGENEVTALMKVIHDYISWIYPPVFTLLSLTNILAFVVFLQPSMRKVHTNVYLAFLAVADFVYVNSTTWANIQEIAEGKCI